MIEQLGQSTEEKKPVIQLTKPWEVLTLSVEDFLVGMCDMGTSQEVSMVGGFADPSDEKVRTAHRDIDLPFHRDGIYTQSIADLQGGMYVERPNVDIVGMYCIRDNDGQSCYTILSEDEAGTKIVGEVDLRAGQALIWRNTLWHGRRGAVGKRILIRFWVTQLDASS